MNAIQQTSTNIPKDTTAVHTYLKSTVHELGKKPDVDMEQFRYWKAMEELFRAPAKQYRHMGRFEAEASSMRAYTPAEQEMPDAENYSLAKSATVGAAAAGTAYGWTRLGHKAIDAYDWGFMPYMKQMGPEAAAQVAAMGEGISSVGLKQAMRPRAYQAWTWELRTVKGTAMVAGGGLMLGGMAATEYIVKPAAKMVQSFGEIAIENATKGLKGAAESLPKILDTAWEVGKTVLSDRINRTLLAAAGAGLAYDYFTRPAVVDDSNDQTYHAATAAARYVGGPEVMRAAAPVVPSRC